MEILNVRQHTKTHFTATVTDDYGLEHPVRVLIDHDGAVLFQVKSTLSAGGYSSTPISAIVRFLDLGLIRDCKKKFFGTGPLSYAATEQEMLGVILHASKIPAEFAGIIHGIAQRVRDASSGLLTAPEPAPAPKPSPRVRRTPSQASLADQAAGIAWLTAILADTTLPYSLHEQALSTRAGLLTIRDTLQETN